MRSRRASCFRVDDIDIRDRSAVGNLIDDSQSGVGGREDGIVVRRGAMDAERLMPDEVALGRVAIESKANRAIGQFIIRVGRRSCRRQGAEVGGEIGRLGIVIIDDILSCQVVSVDEVDKSDRSGSYAETIGDGGGQRCVIGVEVTNETGSVVGRGLAIVDFRIVGTIRHGEDAPERGGPDDASDRRDRSSVDLDVAIVGAIGDAQPKPSRGTGGTADKPTDATDIGGRYGNIDRRDDAGQLESVLPSRLIHESDGGVGLVGIADDATDCRHRS